MDNLVSNSDDYETLLLYLQQLANDYSPVALGNKVWIVLGGSFLVIVGLFVALCKIERFYKVDSANTFVYKVKDETKILNEIHICSTLAHDVANVNRCVSLLMESPSAVNVPRDPFGFTPFLNACWAGCKPLIRFMLLNGANVERKTKEGDSALYLAVRSLLQESQPDFQLLTILLQAGCAINEVNFSGYTPLHLAASAGNLEITKWLVNNGADFQLKTSSGQTASQLAQIGGYQAVVQFLVSLSKKKK